MKKLKKIMAGIMAAATIFTFAPLTANAAIEIPLEKTDVEGYDFYSCTTTYYDNENGEMVPVYHDIYGNVKKCAVKKHPKSEIARYQAA